MYTTQLFGKPGALVHTRRVLSSLALTGIEMFPDFVFVKNFEDSSNSNEDSFKFFVNVSSIFYCTGCFVVRRKYCRGGFNTQK